MPGWCKDYLTKDQARIKNPYFRWLLMIRKAEISTASYAIACTIYTYHAGNESAWPSQEQIAEACKMSERTVIRGLVDLEEQGWLLVQRDRDAWGYKHNEYFMCWPAFDVINNVAKQPLQESE